ncbi:hypothetical protein IV203_027470 [Nitzschia inconspicua]|uniref:Uncharacterized protein n=1 Tax=Nitzschia inconspicua TaxID=303405 RepID=A0A9K3LWA1_9STRA|nr:hypothetical protein IV203_027470 [Nitzschia inconspicua]
MKFCVSAALAGIAAVDAMSIRGSSQSAQGLMNKARRIQQNNGYYQGYYGGGQQYGGQYGQNMQQVYSEMDDESMWFLSSYSIRLLTCIQGQQVINYQEHEGSVESSTVVFRLCPASSCDVNVTEFGCEAGYGDYAVGINTFLNAFLESQRELYGDEIIYYNAMGEEFSVNEYAQCAEYRVPDNQNQAQNYYSGYQNGQYQQNGYYGYQNGQYQQNGNGYYGNRNLENNNWNQWYIGPGCTSDGKDIRFALYRDQYCTYSPGVTMKEINYAWQNGMPFEEGGLIKNDCHDCMVRDQDYNAEITAFCSDNFRSAISRCEANMSTWSYMGPNTNGCDYVTNLEHSVFGDAMYGTTSNSAVNSTEAAAHEETLQEVALRFMDKLNTRQTRAFIAAMVIFSLSACIGATLFTCMCYRKRRARKRAKALVANKDVYEGKGDTVPEIKAKTSIVDLVRTSSKRATEAIASAAMGTKVAASTAAAGAAAAITRSSSKKVSVENSDYANMEDDIEKIPTEGSYKAPTADITSAKSKSVDVASVKSGKSKKSVASVKTASSMHSNKSIPATISTQPIPREEETSEVQKPPIENSGGILGWLGWSGSAKEAEKSEQTDSAGESADDENEETADDQNTSTNKETTKLDLTSQMDDYFSQKFT